MADSGERCRLERRSGPERAEEPISRRVRVLMRTRLIERLGYGDQAGRR